MKLSSLFLRSMSVALLGLCISGLHCGGGISSRCEEKIACEGGVEADQSACETALTANEDIADLKGCITEFDELFDCEEEYRRCNNDRYELDDNRCLQEIDRYNKCTE